MKESEIKSFDGSKLHCYLWDDVDKPVGIVQIIHGMAEHAMRYDDFAKFLNKNGYLVFADDHRAHGKTAGDVKNVGKYPVDSNIFYDTTEDELFITEMLIKKYNLPLVVLGHSYGSIITQKYIQSSSLHAGAILSGTNYMDTMLNKIAIKIARMTRRHYGDDAPANMIEKLSFGSYNKKFKTGLWITSNEKIAKEYIDDPYCGTPFSAKFYDDMLTASCQLYNNHRLERIDKNIPIFLISGKQDLFGLKGKGVIKLYKAYAYHDIRNIQMKLYPNMRHEILNEIGNDEVYHDVLAFINEVCGQTSCIIEEKENKKLKKTKATLTKNHTKK